MERKVVGEAAAARPAGARAPMRDFWLVLTGQALSMQADGLANLAVLWWIAQDTGSVGLATALAAATMVPVIVLGPLLPFVAEQRLGLDAAGYGFLLSSMTVGTLAGAVGMSVAGARIRRGIAVLWSLVVIGLALLAVGGLTVVAPVVAAFVVMGVALSVANVCASTLFQTRVPREIQGRVFAVRSSISQAAGPLALALVGALSASVAPHVILVVSGVIVVGGGLLGYAVPGLAAAE